MDWCKSLFIRLIYSDKADEQASALRVFVFDLTDITALLSTQGSTQ